MSKIFKSIDEIQPIKNKGTEDIGSGSFSKVKLVSHKQDPDKWYAMKEVEIKNEKDRKMVFQEINLHMTLNHPNIIRFEDYLETPEKIYIFLEYAKNGDLFGFMNKNKPNDQILLKIFHQTCMAIEYIHSKSIMHRDLKPENILLDANNNVKLCDFGWSAEYLEEVNRETLCGTFEYMAPEVFFRNKQTKKTDIWALGILLYELFHGYAPFRGIRMDTVMYAIMRNVVSFKKSVPPDVKDLIVKILIFDPKKRPSIEDILEHKLITDFVKSKGDPSPEKENVNRIPKTLNVETKEVKPKPLVFSNSFYNTINESSESKQEQNTLTKNNIVKNQPKVINTNSAFKPTDYTSYFKKKAKTEDFSSFKSYNSVDKISTTTQNVVKKFKPSYTQAQSTSSTFNIYTTKPTLTQTQNINTPSGVKIISQRVIKNPNEVSKDSSGFSTYTRPDFDDTRFKNIYETPFSQAKYNFSKQKSNPDDERKVNSSITRK